MNVDILYIDIMLMTYRILVSQLESSLKLDGVLELNMK